MARILVIDDDAQFLDMLAQMLARAGHQVECAVDGEEGLKRFRDAPAELVITDILMPRKEGLETILELRREYPDLKIIAISGGGTALLPQYNLDLAGVFGAQAILAKPFTRQEILGKIQGILDAA